MRPAMLGDPTLAKDFAVLLRSVSPAAAVPLRSQFPRTSQNTPNSAPATLSVFAAFADLWDSLTGDFHRGEGLISAFLCGFRRLCGLFAVPSHEASRALISSVVAQRQALSAAATPAAQASAVVGSS
jgi:hypothetical protein